MILPSEAAKRTGVAASALFYAGASREAIVDLLVKGQKTVTDMPFLDTAYVRCHEAGSDALAMGFEEQPGPEERLAAACAGARSEGYEVARAHLAEQLTDRLAQERQRIERVRLEFARDRQRFFAAAESQVVQLALAVARKILHRDADLGMLPLRATVKAALARMQDGSSTVLRVPAQDWEAWLEVFPPAELDGDSPGRVEVRSDASLQPGDCVLETGVGRVELGFDVQLEEIERGFRELMQNQGSE